jgi:hypothetical protein
VCVAAAGDEPLLELWAHPESASAVMIVASTSTIREVVTQPTVRGTADRAGRCTAPRWSSIVTS